jgi:hypothetical protein
MLPEEEIEVAYVQAHVRKLRFFSTVPWPPDDDLRCCWWPPSHPALPDWEDGGYYLSKCAFTHPDGTVLPPNTPFIVSELTEGKLFTQDAPNPDDPVSFGGDYLELTALDPATGEPRVFGFWHGVQEDQSKNFDLVENPLVVIAIAATGL